MPATADGLCTAAIQQAIDACAQRGGGRVTLAAGRYTSGSLHLRDRVELHLEHGAVLRAADGPAHFRPIGQHDEELTANSGFAALINAIGVTDCALTGSGTLHGGGDLDRAPDWKTAQAMFRPAVAYFENCRQTSIRDLVIEGSRWWTLHLLRCDDTQITGIRIRNNWPNSDGIDPDGCRHMVISDCHIDAGDDCIVAKSTQGDPCENITVTNCVLRSTCACLKLGTESRGPFRNMTFANCVLVGSVGFALYLKDNGLMENIVATNLTLDVPYDWPIVIDGMARDYRRPPAGRIRNVALSNLMVRSPGRVLLEGPADEPLENIALENILWQVTGPVRPEGRHKPLGSVRVILDPARVNHAEQPHHIIAANINGLSLARFQLTGPAADRELLFCHNVRRTA